MPGLAVVAMLEPLHPVRVVDEHRVRAGTADGVHDVAEELPGVLELAVGIAEHDHVLDAHEVRGGALLRRPAACASSSGVSDRSAVPASPLVHST